MLKLFMLFSILFTPLSFAKMKICMEDTQWIPLIFSGEKNRPTGVIVEIAKLALEQTSINYSFHVLPWKRCLQYVRDGVMDSALGASFNKERSTYMDYPTGAKRAAKNNEKAEFRIIQADYVVVSLASQNFEFTGEFEKIPSPIYIPSGYSIASDLRELGLEVDSQAKEDLTNFLKLEKRKIGSVIVIRPLAERYIRENVKKNFFKISKKSIKSKSTFLTFSKKTKIKKNLQLNIWNAIKNVRETQVNKIIQKY